MSLNNEYRFGAVPTMKWDRTLFKMKSNTKTTLNVGDIVPIYVNQDIYPSETYEFIQSLVCRSLTPLNPTMDNLVLDIYAFFDQKRRLWDNFKKFMGENESGAWVVTADIEEPNYYVPSNATGSGIPGKGTLWDYFGLATGIKSSSSDNEVWASALPFRAYWDIYNYFFRNQSLIAPVNVNKTDSNYAWSILGPKQKPAKASKLPDYFTTALPEPQKAPNGAIRLPLGTSAPLTITKVEAPTITYKSYGVASGDLQHTSHKVIAAETFTGEQTIDGTNAVLKENSNEAAEISGFAITGYADLSEATASTINALRLFVQTQKVYELDGIFGTRYFDEILYGHFATRSGAAQYEKPQFLGAKRVPIVMNQVAQTVGTSDAPLGYTGAFSLTTDNGKLFKQSFTEHGIILILAVIRQLEHTTQQCIPRQWRRKKRLDYFWHEFEHLGNQPIYNYEIYADGSSYDNEVFGYQERYAELRFDINRITGEFRSTYTTPLDSWHYGDIYDSLPVLSKEWIQETNENVKRTLAIQNQDQFWIDTTFYIKAWKALSPYGTPGLVDHL